MIISNSTNSFTRPDDLNAIKLLHGPCYLTTRYRVAPLVRDRWIASHWEESLQSGAMLHKRAPGVVPAPS